MRNFSKFPWTLKESNGTTEVASADGGTVCDNEMYYPQHVAEDDMHLIAAAPEMYVLLKQILRAYEANEEWCGRELEPAIKIRAVLKKVEGGK